ncbi:hypothetical protein CEP54_000637 [Fusarium duplospermum]|uniref:Uncharacterized protein n=1 Tax=Fusarium duplospermum TaxID=1325734 RepID=A0A428R5J7_9HYPO|nr:hypothetical protein CEP54_000637 [Fusarium duplospermum]
MSVFQGPEPARLSRPLPPFQPLHSTRIFPFEAPKSWELRFFERAHLTTLSAVPPLSLLFSSSHRLEASSLPSLSPSSRRHNLCFSLPVAEFLSIANFNFIVAVRFSGE